MAGKKSKAMMNKNRATTVPLSGRGKKRAAQINDEDVINNNHFNSKRQKVQHASHSKTQGCALTLGEGDTGQLGLGPEIMERTKPAKVPDVPENIVQVVAGGMHSVLLTANGEVWTFGCNDEGALGRPTSEEGSETEPSRVELNQKITQISAGDSHSAALTQEGTIYMWGTFRDANGSIGLTSLGKIQPTPIEVPCPEPVSKICSGNDHIVCLTESEQVYSFGNAEQGQLGRVPECFSNRGGRKGLAFLLNPMRVTFRKRKARFCDVWAGQYHSFAKDRDTGDIYCWGLNNYYQLGFGDMVNRYMPEKVKAFSKEKGWRLISGGQHHTLALDKEGQVYSLGRKEYGRLGLGEENLEEQSSPTVVPVLRGKKCINISAGTATSFAIQDDGTLYAWGMGTSNQLAQADDEDVFEPARMLGKNLQERKGVQISAGGQHVVILAKDK